MNAICNSTNRSLFVGLLIMVIGIGFLLKQFRFFSPEVEDALFTWPVILILSGLYFILCKESRVTGYILLVVGGTFWLNHLRPWDFDFSDLIVPLILIGIGVIIISKHTGKRIDPENKSHFSFTDQEINDGEYFNDTNIFGGSNKMINIKNLRGGRMTAVFGGSEINLSHSQLSAGTNVIDVLYIFGGSSLIIPADWTVHIDVVSIFGGFSDKRMIQVSENTLPEKTLYIKGTVLFGGGEIKRY